LPEFFSSLKENKQPINKMSNTVENKDQELEVSEELVTDIGELVLQEEVDLTALRKIRDNFSEFYKRCGGSVVIDQTDIERKAINEKAARKLVSEYYNIKSKSNKIEYHYLARLKSGRRFSHMSLQNLSRKVRHTISKDIYHDIDIKNAHPTFCLQLAKKLNIDHPILEKYVNDRNSCFESWIGYEITNFDK
jgi:DNA mismatch repair ATPase MutS